MAIQLVLFLGNPGAEYARTRHNAGRLTAAALARSVSGIPPPETWRGKFKGRYTALGSCHLLMPDTFMNASGDSAGAAARFLHIPPEAILVVHDELDLPLGYGSLKWAGGLNGHNGLRSIKAALGTADFWRFRIGIGRPLHGTVVDWVLTPFQSDELVTLDTVLAGACSCLGPLCIDHADPATFLTEWGKKRLAPA